MSKVHNLDFIDVQSHQGQEYNAEKSLTLYLVSGIFENAHLNPSIN